MKNWKELVLIEDAKSDKNIKTHEWSINQLEKQLNKADDELNKKLADKNTTSSEKRKIVKDGALNKADIFKKINWHKNMIAEINKQNDSSADILLKDNNLRESFYRLEIDEIVSILNKLSKNGSGIAKSELKLWEKISKLANTSKLGKLI